MFDTMYDFTHVTGVSNVWRNKSQNIRDRIKFKRSNQYEPNAHFDTRNILNKYKNISDKATGGNVNFSMNNLL